MKSTNADFFQDVETGEWVHIVKTVDGSETKIYINGALRYKR